MDEINIKLTAPVLPAIDFDDSHFDGWTVQQLVDYVRDCSHEARADIFRVPDTTIDDLPRDQQVNLLKQHIQMRLRQVYDLAEKLAALGPLTELDSGFYAHMESPDASFGARMWVGSGNRDIPPLGTFDPSGPVFHRGHRRPAGY